MDEQAPKFTNTPEPNVVLRGGPFDGKQRHVTGFPPIDLENDGRRYIYRPTGEIDDEYPTLGKYVLDHDEPA